MPALPQYNSHLAKIMPFLSDVEMKKVKDEVAAAKELVVIFDGTTYCAETLAILFRYITADDWTIQQSLVCMHVLAKSLSGPQLARELGTCLSTRFQLPPQKVIAAVRDGAVVNRAPLCQGKVLSYPSIFDIICFSHSLDNVGKNFSTTNVDAMAKCIAPEKRRRQRELIENAKQRPVLLEEVQSP